MEAGMLFFDTKIITGTSGEYGIGIKVHNQGTTREPTGENGFLSVEWSGERRMVEESGIHGRFGLGHVERSTQGRRDSCSRKPLDCRVCKVDGKSNGNSRVLQGGFSARIAF